MSPARGSDSARRVWITGHNGFTGHFLTEALTEAGFEPVPAAPLSEFDLRVVSDIERELDRVRPDYVIHLAAVSFVAHGEAADFYAVNTVGTLNLLERLAQSGHPVRKVIVASSAN